MSQPQRVMTAYGPGVVVATETVRGATQYKVEGEGFSVWLTAAQVPEFGQLEWDQSEDHTWDNSTTLPYNPQPQFPARGTGESTIQPNQHIDPERRLAPADSVSFQTQGEPHRDLSHLFARTAAQSIDELSPELRQTVEFAHQHAYDWALDQGYGFDDAEDYASWFSRYVMSIEEIPDYSHESMSRDWISERGGEDPRYAAQLSAAPRPDLSVPDIQARLGDKYVPIPVDIDRSSLQARLDDDPHRTVADVKMANFERRGELDPQIGQHWDLTEANAEVRTAAWADVRSKAVRLRRNGNVQLEAANPSAIVATVTGDHGIYDVAVLRGNVLTGSSAVTEWTCSCPWGDWAFERQHTYVGRLCSHAYAALLELQALNRRKEKPYGWSTAARYPREDGRLSTEPGTLTPDLNFIPKQRRRDRLDVTAGHQVQSNAFDEFMDFTEGGQYGSDQEAFDDYRNYRDMTGRPVTQDEIDELNRIGVEVQAFLSEPFAGSGPDQPESYSTSAEYVQYLDNAGGHYHTDVDGPGANPAMQNADDVMPPGRGASIVKHDLSGADVEHVDVEDPDSIAKTGAADDPLAHLLGSNPEPAGGQFDFAAAAQAHLRTAGRQFTFAEQQALIDEAPSDGAPIDQDELDLRGTHYLP